MVDQATKSEGEKAVVPADATRQLSYSGTPRGPDGVTQPDDYVRELANPVKRMEIFEEMGQGDDAVNVGIMARRQEICAANWKLATEEKGDRGVEILEFVEDNIYPVLDDLLRWLGGGAMQYGFGAVEPVFQWSDSAIVSAISRGRLRRPTRRGERRIYIRKLAHIRQTGVETFKIAGPDDASGSLAGDLLEIRQHVYDGSSFRRREIPAEKALLWTYDRQGDDYWGVPPARHCYKAWKFKTQMERLNLLHIDKFGVGTVVVEEGEGWTELERQRMAQFVAAWRSGSCNYVMHPSGGSISIVGDEGKGTMSVLEWVRYYNLQTAKTYLTHGTELGSTETGARALGETFQEQLGGIVQADCEALASLINNQLIVPLVRYNFGEQQHYPTFAPSQRVKLSGGIATVLQQLIAAGAVHVRPEDEAWLRDALELPSVDLNTLQQEADERKAVADAAALAATQAKPGKPGTDDRKPPVKIAATRELAGIAQLADGAPDPAKYRETTYRSSEYSAWEHGILRPDVLSRDLDNAVTRATSEVQDVLRLIDAELTNQVAKLAAKGASALSAGVRTIEVPERLRVQLRKVLLVAAQRARDYGGQSVVNEIERQTGPGAIGPQRAPSYGARHQLRELANESELTPEDLHIRAEVDRAVEEEIDRREQSARSAALTAIAQAAGAAASVLATIVIAAAKEGLIGLSPYRTSDNVEGVINVGFGVGRSETAKEIVGVEVAAGQDPVAAAQEQALATSLATTARSAAAAQSAAVDAAAATRVALDAVAKADLPAGVTAIAIASQKASIAATATSQAATAAASTAAVAAASGDNTVAAETATTATLAASAAVKAEGAAQQVAAASEHLTAAATSGDATAVTQATATATSAVAATVETSTATGATTTAAKSTETAHRSRRRPATTGAGGGNRSGLRDTNGNPMDLVGKVYSAVMDMGTCDECAKWDGAEFPIDYPEDYTGVQAPNPRCAGSYKRCRCVWIYLTSREQVPLVPASKGPQPIRR